ncbi:MAG: hypothetical protein M1335_07015 [Chloroflexi bacterium]|nr:hypothetical protein [Chloroflexota bacterium]
MKLIFQASGLQNGEPRQEQRIIDLPDGMAVQHIAVIDPSRYVTIVSASGMLLWSVRETTGASQ